MSEELKQQLSEQVPGAMKAFEKALGVTSQGLSQMMENGELIAEEVLPKVGKAFAELAREGGSLKAALKNARVAQGQFTIGMQEAVDNVFKSGFGQGLTELFQTLTSNMEESEYGIKKLGKVFELIFKSLAKASDILMPILDAVFSVIGGISEVVLDIFSNKIGAILGGTAAMAAGLWKVNAAALALNTNLTLVLRRLLFIPMAVLGVLHEIQAVFDNDLTGIFDINYKPEEGSIQDFSRSSFNMADNLGRIAQYFNSKSGEEVSKEVPKPFIKENTQADRMALDINLSSTDSNIKAVISDNRNMSLVTSG